MKIKLKYILLLNFFLNIPLFSQTYDRNVLIEVFTNSHCPLCPGAHATVDSYLANGTYRDQVNYIYYHMSFPYSDDALYQHNTVDPPVRNNYYGPFSGTPRGFFDGTVQGSNYSQWETSINTRAMVNTPIAISLNGTKDGSTIELNANVTIEQNIPGGDLLIHFVAVEDINYSGRNGINFHKNVMRKMYPSASGRTIISTGNQVIQETLQIDPEWNTNNLSFVVFIQSQSSKEVYQSESIDYNELSITSVNEETISPNKFNLYQNYPNPFNPTTIIKFTIPQNSSKGKTILKIFDLLGNEIALLVDEYKPAGIYEVEFNTNIADRKLSSGIYFYRLQYADQISTKKLTLLK
jgi:hypothetical protein